MRDGANYWFVFLTWRGEDGRCSIILSSVNEFGKGGGQEHGTEERNAEGAHMHVIKVHVEVGCSYKKTLKLPQC